MRVQDIIRNMLNLIDGGEQEPIEPEFILKPDHKVTAGDDINRFRQIIDLADSPERHRFINEPNPAYADLDSVTIHAGGGMNGPKHPADIRVKDPSAYPHLIDTEIEEPVSDHPEHIVMIKTMRGQ
jgi:hypothetical protein